VAAALGVVATDDGLDQAVVAIVAAVQDRDPLGLGVDEDEELVAELLHRGDGILLEHRLDGEALDLDDPGFPARSLGAVGETAEDLLLLLRSGSKPWLLLVLDRLALGLVDDVIERLLVARTGRSSAKHLTVDDQRDLGDVRFRRVLVPLAPELHGGIGLIVEEPLDPPEFSLRVLADAIGDLGILALDDRPQTNPRGRSPTSR
jgi:hypothetical protein